MYILKASHHKVKYLLHLLNNYYYNHSITVGSIYQELAFANNLQPEPGIERQTELNHEVFSSLFIAIAH